LPRESRIPCLEKQFDWWLALLAGTLARGAAVLPVAQNLEYEHWGPNGLEGTLKILPRRDPGALATGLDLLAEHPLILLGFSPGNAYFTRKRIEVAICGMARLFSDVTLVIPDTISAHTYRALGLSEQKSQAKAREHGVNIRNRCLAAMRRVCEETPGANLRLLHWDTDVTALPAFPGAYAEVSRQFAEDATFQADVMEKGAEVLRAKLGVAPTAEAVREGAQYLLKEFAYLRISRPTFGRDLVIPYYQNFTLGHRFCDGGYGEALPGVGWLIYEIELFDPKEGDGNDR
jgi:tRNA-dependent cyclodipeptide synthase